MSGVGVERQWRMSEWSGSRVRQLRMREWSGSRVRQWRMSE